MRRRIAAGWALPLLAGCVGTQVVASQLTAGASEGTEEDDLTAGSDADDAQGDGDDATADSDSDSDADSDSDGNECDAPTGEPGCDALADPLRAPEIACHPGIQAATFQTADGDAWRRAHELGNAYWVAEASDAVLVMSTGRLPQPGPAGQVAVDPGAAQLASVANDNPDDGLFPDPIVIAPGSSGGAGGTPFFDCDGVGDCSDTLPGALAGASVHDLLWLRFEVDVPPDVHGYALRLALLTAEYPERLEPPFGDMFVWWASGDSFTGNLATWGGQPASASGLANRLSQHSGEHPMLLRTGFDGGTGEACTVGGRDLSDCPLGAGSGWLELRGPAEPGEHLTIAAALFDTGDAQLDTVVVLDDWHWECAGCRVGESCGLSVPSR